MPSFAYCLPVASAASLNAAGESADARQLTVAGANSVVPIVYGYDRIGALLLNVIDYGTSVVCDLLWCHACTGVSDLRLSDKALPDGATATHYTGSQVAADATLVSAFAAKGITFNEARTGFAYSVVVLPADKFSGAPAFTALIAGIACYDPRKDSTAGGSGSHRLATPATWEFTECPALALANFLSNRAYGAGKTLDWSSVAAVADANDYMVAGTEKRRMIGWSLSSSTQLQSVIEALRTYAGCFVVTRGATLMLAADAPAAAAATYDHAAGDFVAVSAIDKRDTGGLPTVVEIAWTDSSSYPWKEQIAVAERPGVADGTVPRRVSRVRMNGIRRYAQARREAIERLNKLWLSDTGVAVTVWDQGIKHEQGDVVRLVLPYGGVDFLFRVSDPPALDAAGQWTLNCVEYADAMYSDAIETETTTSDTTLPSPSAPPVPTITALTEELFQQKDGTFASRLRLQFSSAAYPWRDYALINCSVSGTLIFSGQTRGYEYVTPAVKEGETYTLEVATVSRIGTVSAFASSSVVAQGKLLPPQPVPAGTFSAFEAGGTVHLSWSKAVDIDVVRYQIRVGSTATAWADATIIDEVDSLRYAHDGQPAGTWRYWIDSIDSVKTLSGTPRYVDVVVTLDFGAFLVSSYEQTTPSVSNMTLLADYYGAGVQKYVTDDGIAWNTKLSGTLNSYTNPLLGYWSTLASSWTGESEDFGQDSSGNWSGTATVADIAGSHTSVLQLALSATPTTWTDFSGMVAKTMGRFARLKHSAAIGSAIAVTMPTQNIRLDVTPRTEYFSGTSSAAGGVTVTLAGTYTKVKAITIAVNSASARTWTFDSVDLVAKTFKVYVFNAAGALVASDFTGMFEGV